MVRSEVWIKVYRSGEGFLIAGDIGDRKKKELVALWIDLSGRKDSRETMPRSEIRRIWWIRWFGYRKGWRRGVPLRLS